MNDEILSKRCVLPVCLGLISPLVYGVCISTVPFLCQRAQSTSIMPAAGICWILNICLYGGAFFSNIFLSGIANEATRLLSLASILFACGFPLFLVSDHRVIYIGRLFCGLGAGIATSIVPVFTRLVTPPHFQGFVAAFYGVCIVAGIILGLVWSYFNLCLTSISILMCALLILQTCLLRSCSPVHLPSTAAQTSYLSFLLNPKALRSLIVIALLHLGQHLCGINHILLNAPTIFPAHDATLTLIGLCSVALFATFFSSLLVHRFNRRPLLIASCVAMIISCCAFFFAVYQRTFALLFILGYNTAISCLPFVLIGEIFPPADIGRGATFATSCNWFGAALSICMLGGDTKQYHPAFLVYIGYQALLVLIILRFFTETKGKAACYQ